jgi:hypothetical protein
VVALSEAGIKARGEKNARGAMANTLKKRICGNFQLFSVQESGSAELGGACLFF